MITCHIGAFCFDARQFGAFHFGDFHFDAVPVRCVSFWRASTSARFSLARFHFGAFLFGAFPTFVSKLMHNRLLILIICFLSARVFCEEVLSTPVLLRSHSILGLLSRITFCVFLLYASYMY